MCTRRRLPWRSALWSVLLLAAAPAAAEPPPKQDASDLRVELAALAARMALYADAPQGEDPSGTLHHAWRSHLKPRSARLMAAAKDLARESLWVLDKGEERILALDPAKWSGLVRRVGSLYTALGATGVAYAGTKVDFDPLRRRWLLDHPEPSTTGPTAAGVELGRLQRLIAMHRARGEPVPAWIHAEIARLREVERIEIAERLETHRLWTEERARAFVRIEEGAAATRARVQEQRDHIAEDMTFLRTWVARVQAIEERRLAAVVAASSLGAAVHAATEELLKAMARGRAEGFLFRDARTSRYGSIVRQGWMVPRAKLLDLLRTARKHASPSAEDD